MCISDAPEVNIPKLYAYDAIHFKLLKKSPNIEVLKVEMSVTYTFSNVLSTTEKVEKKKNLTDTYDRLEVNPILKN